jgi:hypothetical protein
MPYSHFSIWDNDLATFLENLESEGIETANLKKWFYERGAYLIHQNEVSTLSVYIKDYLKKNKCFPTIDGVGLAGYMMKILRLVEKEFWLFFNEIEDQETKNIIENQFAKFIIAAFENHDEFYEWRVELSTTKMFAFVKQVKKFDGDAQNQFVEQEIELKLADQEITPELRSDVQNFLTFTREINVNMTPMTKKRGVYYEKSEGRSELRVSPLSSPNIGSPSPITDRTMKGRFNELNGGSPLSILRNLQGAGSKTPSSRTGTVEDSKDEAVELSTSRGMGLK